MLAGMRPSVECVRVLPTLQQTHLLGERLTEPRRYRDLLRARSLRGPYSAQKGFHFSSDDCGVTRLTPISDTIDRKPAG